MAERLFIFRAGSTELVLPVTPDSYRVETGVNVEVVNIHQLGDAIMTGYGTLSTISISCLLPERSYHFAQDSGPQHYVEQLAGWVEDKQRLRFIVSDTGVNVPVVIERISYGERDGTNDVYADITLREYRQLEAVQTSAAPAENAPREAVSKPSGGTTHPIVAGDTLSAICRYYYGDGSAATYEKLAAVNGISNPHLIYAGKQLKIPQPLA